MSAREEGGQRVVALCRAVNDDLDALVPGIVDRIRGEIPGYAVVGRAEHEQAVTVQYEGLLTGLITRRPPSREESERARELGRRRAQQGLALESMVSAYHVGYREMWNILLQRAGSDDQAMRSELAGLVGTVWMWIERASSAAADAYGEAVRAEDAARLALTHRFLDALTAGGPPTAEHAHIAQALGFDPAGRFQAVCSPGVEWSEEDIEALRSRMRRHRGAMLCANRDNALIAVLQGVSADVFLDVLRGLGPRPAGVGLVREGLTGAGVSILDAREVLPADGTGVARYEDDWLAATVRPQSGRLTALLGPCAAAAGKHPDLAETIRAFARHGFSLTGTGRALHIHPNTVRYRLDRWQEVTGFDVRTWAGLSASMVGLDLSRRPGS
ncbi:PucR family transcriptional regulator [Streptomyces sp. NPDC093984]|uniref:PucR family transcriptional regulator n=1 Tax=Streptomyces sp. NPDC093984 TaxID=3366052 RepID=UPI003805F8C5